jgi:hypothetical protein
LTGGTQDSELRVSSRGEEGRCNVGASFWEIKSVVNKLHDGHVQMPQINAAVLSGLAVFLHPERCADGAVKTQHSFLNDPVTGDLQLKIEWKDENGAKNESVVESMDRMSPYEFFLKVSNSLLQTLFFQSRARGARFNTLLMNIQYVTILPLVVATIPIQLL